MTITDLSQNNSNINKEICDYIYHYCNWKGSIVITENWEILTKPPLSIRNSNKDNNWSSVITKKYVINNLVKKYWRCIYLRFRKDTKRWEINIISKQELTSPAYNF